jgi:hypothetical protein
MQTVFSRPHIALLFAFSLSAMVATPYAHARSAGHAFVHNGKVLHTTKATRAASSGMRLTSLVSHTARASSLSAHVSHTRAARKAK